MNNETEAQRNEISEALRIAKAEIYDKKENCNAAFVIAFANQFLQDAKASGKDKEFEPIDYILHGSLIGYALRYMNENKKNIKVATANGKIVDEIELQKGKENEQRKNISTD
jgi:hypothetical protein